MTRKEKMIKEQKCDNCLYSRLKRDPITGMNLHCLRDLPAFEARFSARGYWPIVYKNDWCGEWESE